MDRESSSAIVNTDGQAGAAQVDNMSIEAVEITLPNDYLEWANKFKLAIPTLHSLYGNGSRTLFEVSTIEKDMLVELEVQPIAQ